MPDVPTPDKLFIAAYPTPSTADFFLFINVQTQTAGYVAPEYGNQLPVKFRTQYPNHFLTAIVPNQNYGDGWTIHIYASKRDGQDAYNYDVEYPEGNTAFPTILRTYIYLRSEYAESGPLAVGTADPGLLPDETPQFPDAILCEAEKMMEGTGDPHIDSLFVRVQRKFQRIPDLTDSADLAQAKTFGYLVEYPYGLTKYPRVTWKIPCTAETVTVPLTDVCPIPGYTTATFGADSNQSLVSTEQSYKNDKGVVVALMRTYEANPGPLVAESDYEPRTGSAIRTTKQIVAASLIPSTVALLNAEINGYGSVALTSIVNGLATTATAHGLTVGQEIYFSGATIGGGAAFTNGTASGVGAYFVKTMPSTTTFTFAKTTNGSAFAGASDDATGGTLYKRTLPRGTTIEYKPMGMDGLRAIKVISSIDLSSLDYLQGAADVVYYGSENFSFPDVLESASWGNAEAYTPGVTWAFDATPAFILTEGYRGPCRARITERYVSNPSAPGFLDNLPVPTAIQGGTSLVGFAFAGFSGTHGVATARVWQVPNSIHGAITMAEGGRPAYATAGNYVSDIPATPTTTTPLGWLVADTKPEKWRFGMWVWRVIEIIHP